MAIIGIDLGTTTSEAAIFRNSHVEMIKNEHSEDITPSVIALGELRELIFGKKAKKEAYKDYAKQFKRDMGTDKKTRLGDKEYSPVELSSLLLRYIKKYAEEFLGERVDRAVITVPANFSESQRNATIRAGELAGLKVERIIHEPTAAALAFAHSHPEMQGKIMVYDLGGGTFDVTILDFMGDICDVVWSEGDVKLGGSDFDRKLIQHLLQLMRSDDGLELDLDDQGVEGLKRKHRLEEGAEEHKINLSFEPQTTVNIPYLAVNKGEPYSLEKTLTRSSLETLIRSDIDRTFECVARALKGAKLTQEDVDYVLLVGGSSRIPMVREHVAVMFGEEKVLKNIDPDRAIAMGAAIQAKIIESGGSSDGPALTPLDVVPLAIGTDVSQYLNNLLVHGFYSEIIPANSPMQREFSENYVTVVDNQPSIRVKVFQKASMNDSIFVKDMEELVPDDPEDSVISGIPPAPAGEQSVTITFSYNKNGTVDVRAVLDSTGKSIKFSAKKTFRLESDVDLVDQTWEDSELAKQFKVAQNLIESRLPGLNASQQQTLNDILKRMKDAVLNKDSETFYQIDDELTNFLYDIG